MKENNWSPTLLYRQKKKKKREIPKEEKSHPCIIMQSTHSALGAMIRYIFSGGKL